MFHGAETTAEPFKPGRSISGFRTGPLGLGHVVMHTANTDEMVTFYRDLLGFRLTDYYYAPFKATFMHLNPRHHSLAFIQTGKNAVHHMMMELYSFDDVGQGYDIAQGERPRRRHARPPHQRFHHLVLCWTPSDFMVEYGWGARDDRRRRTGRPMSARKARACGATTAPGCRRTTRTRRARCASPIAEKGFRQPVQVMDGNYNRMPGVCPWWDQMKAQRTGNAIFRQPALIRHSSSRGRQAGRQRRVIVMKAGVASPNGVVIQDVPEPKPKSTDLLVKIKAIALNRADLGSAKGDTSHGAAAGKPIGSEFSGEVIEVGADVRDFKKGDRVMCHSPGSHAEIAVSDYGRAMKIPDGMGFEQAATLPIGLNTLHNALITAGPAQGRRERDGAGRKLRRRHHRACRSPS